jgi:hypothetical protein
MARFYSVARYDMIHMAVIKRVASGLTLSEAHQMCEEKNVVGTMLRRHDWYREIWKQRNGKSEVGVWNEMSVQYVIEQLAMR